MNRVTYDGLDLDPLKVPEHLPLRLKVSALPPSKQEELYRLWEERIISALTSKYFDTSKELLSDGLRKGDLVVYYFLVGRQNSAEMGHTDVVRMLCVNSNRQAVSKVKERYGTGYPLGFVDKTGNLVDVLF